jgi:arabinofuranosyltransferase
VEAFASPIWLGNLWFGTVVLPFRIEWAAVVLGLLLSVGALAAACEAATILSRERGRPGIPLPLGALLFAALPATWELATSGVETGLGLAWIGGSFLCLVDLYRRTVAAESPSQRHRFAVAVLLGLGPLVRADFVLFSIAFVAALVAVAGRPFRPRGARLLGAAAALPLGYELFRLAYCGALAPDIAIDFEPGVFSWLLLVPLAALLAVGYADWSRDRRIGRNRRAIVAATPVLAALALTVAHGRLTLPALFALLLPVAVVPVTRERALTATAAAVAAFALLCSLAASGTAERQREVRIAGRPHPVTIEDYGRVPAVHSALAMRSRGRRVTYVVSTRVLGLFAYAVGPNARVLSAISLAAAHVGDRQLCGS